VKKSFFLLCIFLFSANLSFAQAVINLKSGQSVEGRILERTDDYIKGNFYGVELTYWMDDIESIQLEDGTMIYPNISSVELPSYKAPSIEGFSSNAPLVEVFPLKKPSAKTPSIDRPLAETLPRRVSRPRPGSLQFNKPAGEGEIPPEDLAKLNRAMDMSRAASSVFAMFGLIFFVGATLTYVIFAFCLQRIASKTAVPNGWLAWIPVANFYLMCVIANKPAWWLVLFFVPLANIVFMVLVWMSIAQARNKPGWMGVLIILPLLNLIVPAYLAFSE